MRYSLLVAYLDGEPGSAETLYDFLFEHFVAPGQLHGNAARRMSMVLSLLDSRLSHRLACDFAEHVADLYEVVHPADTRLREAISIKRAWICGEATQTELKQATKFITQAIADAQLEKHRRRIPWTYEFMIPGPTQDWVYDQLVCHAARTALAAVSRSDYCARDSRKSAVRAARLTPIAWGRNDLSETRWQTNQVRKGLIDAAAERS